MKPHFVYKPNIQSLPKTLFWEVKTPNYTLYKQFATKDPRVVGIMFADPTKIDRKKIPSNSTFVCQRAKKRVWGRIY